MDLESTIYVREEDTLMHANLFKALAMREPKMDIAFIKLVAKDLTLLITAPNFALTPTQVGQFKQDTAALAVANQTSGILWDLLKNHLETKSIMSLSLVEKIEQQTISESRY